MLGDFYALPLFAFMTLF